MPSLCRPKTEMRRELIFSVSSFTFVIQHISQVGKKPALQILKVKSPNIKINVVGYYEGTSLASLTKAAVLN